MFSTFCCETIERIIVKGECKMKRIALIGVCLFIFQMLPVQAFAKQYNNMQYDWYFKPSKNNKPATTEPEFEEMLNNHGGIFIAKTNAKELYLTFDNGYENGYTADVLDVLKKKKVPAAFFVTGHYLK